MSFKPFALDGASSTGSAAQPMESSSCWQTTPFTFAATPQPVGTGHPLGGRTRCSPRQLTKGKERS